MEFLKSSLKDLSSEYDYNEVWKTLRLNYNNVTDEYDFRGVANDLHRMGWKKVVEEYGDLYYVAEDAVMYSYIFSGIKRLKEELGKEGVLAVSDGAKPKSGGLKKSFADSVINGDADEVLVFLRNELEGKSTQKDVMMVFRAVMDAGLTRKPTFKEFECDFASVVKVKINNSSFDKYLKKDFKFDESAFEYLVEKARKLR